MENTGLLHRNQWILPCYFTAFESKQGTDWRFVPSRKLQGTWLSIDYRGRSVPSESPRIHQISWSHYTQRARLNFRFNVNCIRIHLELGSASMKRVQIQSKLCYVRVPTHSLYCTRSPYVLYLVCPDVLRAEGENSCGIRVGFIESDSLHYFRIYFYLRCKVYPCLFNQIKIIL
jgi:hypothetical protein